MDLMVPDRSPQLATPSPESSSTSTSNSGSGSGKSKCYGPHLMMDIDLHLNATNQSKHSAFLVIWLGADTVKRGASPTSSLTSSLSSSKLKENSNSFSTVKPSNHLFDDDKDSLSYERGRGMNGGTGKNVLFASTVENSLSSYSISEHLNSNSSHHNSITPTSSR